MKKIVNTICVVVFLLVLGGIFYTVFFDPWGPEIKVEQQKFVVEGGVVYMGVDEYQCSVYKIQTNSTEFTISGHEIKNVIFSGSFEYLIDNETRGQVFGIKELENFTYGTFSIQNNLPDLVPYIFICSHSVDTRELVSKEIIRTIRAETHFVADLSDVNIVYSDNPVRDDSAIHDFDTNPEKFVTKNDKFACIASNYIWTSRPLRINKDGDEITFLNGDSWSVSYGYWGWYLNGMLIEDQVVEVSMVDGSRIDILACGDHVKIMQIQENSQFDHP